LLASEYMFVKKAIYPSLITLVVLLLMQACIRRPVLDVNESIVFDLELLADDDKNFIANTHPNQLLEGTKKLNDSISRSGKNSIVLNSENAFGLKYELKNTSPNEYYEIMVWRKSKGNAGHIVVSDEGSKSFYQANNIGDSTDHAGWERLRLTFYVPPTIQNNNISIYAWNPAGDDAYFDDFSISRLRHEKYPSYPGVSPFMLYVDTLQEVKLIKKREEAFRKGILETEDDDWVDGVLFANEQAHHIELRLKGDWLDHLLGMKWSFRLKLEKELMWNGIRTISVQNPLTRDFLNEWLLHYFCLSEDVLATRYGFIPLYFNDRSRGIYAWEEHFEKYLVESNNRREGPILKLNEDNFWKASLVVKRLKESSLSLPIVPSAEILPFKTKRTTKDPVLLKQFEIAQDLYFQYKNASKPASEIFDVNKLAKYMAMLDLFGTYHGINWHNQRFYYNPVISKLEPIVFDNFSEKGAVKYVSASLIGNVFLSLKEIKPSTIMMANVFRDKKFTDAYIKCLIEITDTVFIQTMLDDISVEVAYYDSLLRIEFPNYLIQNAKMIRKEIPIFEQNVDQFHASVSEPLEARQSQYNSTRHNELIRGLVKAYSEPGTDTSKIVKIENFHSEEIILLGSSKNNKRLRNTIFPEIRVPAINESGPGSISFPADTLSRYVYFMFQDNLESYTVPIRPWRSPGGETPLQHLLATYGDNYKEYFDDNKDGRLILKDGIHEISEPLILPEGYQVIIHEGAVINLINHAGLISYSSVQIKGSESKPVIIKSSDGTGNGFTVLQAPQESVIEHTVFDRLNTVDAGGWTLTGAVTFYESDVKLSHTSFQNNLCEDGLNIIRSDFRISECEFTNTFGDALDVDFGKGDILHTAFNYLNNDAIDVSGSNIFIDQCEINNSNDKGISGGENSIVSINNTSVNGSVLGIASKDHSQLTINNCQINNCRFGLVAFRKKPEFGPAHIIADKITMLSVAEPYMIETGSTCLVDGKNIEAEYEDVVDILYNE